MVIVFNPTAGRRRPGRLSRVLDLLHLHGMRIEVWETQAPGDARALAARAAAEGRRVVVAAGGDGTIAEVAAGLLGSEARLGILPLGTANVLAQELGLPRSARELATVLAGQGVRLLRPGLAQLAGGGERLFVQMLGAGFDAAVVAALPPGLKRLLGRGAYVLQSACELARYRFPVMRVELDGIGHDAVGVVVSKGRFYGGPFLLAPAARCDSPGFQVALLRDGGPRQAALAGMALPLDLLPRLPGLTLHHAQRVRIIGAAPLQADGDAAGRGEVRIAETAQPLPVLAPAA